MPEQNYANHAQIVTAYHKITFPILVLTLIGACVNLGQSLAAPQRLFGAALLLLLTCVLVMTFFYARVFALKAQDRAIRAEENLRHFVATGRLLDSRLDVKQIVALRFASDAEFVALARRAADEQMPPDAIKRAIQAWRPDLYRV